MLYYQSLKIVEFAFWLRSRFFLDPFYVAWTNFGPKGTYMLIVCWIQPTGIANAEISMRLMLKCTTL